LEAKDPSAPMGGVQGEIVDCNIPDLHPTQFAVGMRQVGEQKANFQRQIQAGTFQQVPIPVVRGPNGITYLIDGHHQTRCLWELKQFNAKCEVKRDWSQKPLKEFWKLMVDNKFAFLKSPKFISQHWNKLPTSIAGVVDNAHRSLAGYARGHAFDRTNVPFAEFFWGEFFFRNGIRASDIQANWDATLKRAIEMALTPRAAQHKPALPGLKSPSTSTTQSTQSTQTQTVSTPPKKTAQPKQRKAPVRTRRQSSRQPKRNVN
jgi:hypothetical protein